MLTDNWLIAQVRAKAGAAIHDVEGWIALYRSFAREKMQEAEIFERAFRMFVAGQSAKYVDEFLTTEVNHQRMN